jgi:hypothetical protein
MEGRSPVTVAGPRRPLTGFLVDDALGRQNVPQPWRRADADGRSVRDDPREPRAEAERAAGPAADRSHLIRLAPA